MTLYLKYRPKDFESLVGQKFIKTTLQQSIMHQKLVGAYLFCGPRWTWKTSTARIFAKAINCLDIHDGNPCGKCTICTWFLENNLVDIIEIDAASYTWVDNIREIIEKATFAPTLCKYKVYIIDEVHMLSKGAFNALLKILEEPPAHLKFILATTEIHKIPETILSRCQRYDFKSISDHDLRERLLYVAQSEWLTIDDESLDFIIKQASWGLRNALSLFEQLIYNNEIRFQNILENYWIPQKEVLEQFYQKMIQKDNSLIEEYQTNIIQYNLVLFFREYLFLVKNKMLENIWNIPSTQQHIFILETLEESYLKAKNSVDIQLTFLIGVVKTLHYGIAWVQVSAPVIEKRNETPVQKDITPIPVSSWASQIPSEPQLSHDDVFDIFWWDESPFAWDIYFENSPQDDSYQDFWMPIASPSESWVSIPSSNGFDIEKFISELKKQGAKWALTMSLRGSTLQFDGKKLSIYTKTSIALKMISTSDNMALMNSVLSGFGFENISLDIQ